MPRGYKIFILETKQVFMSRHVTFDKKSHLDFENKVVVLDMPSNVVSLGDNDSSESDSLNGELVWDETLKDDIDPLVKAIGDGSSYKVKSLVDVYAKCRIMSFEPSTT